MLLKIWNSHPKENVLDDPNGRAKTTSDLEENIHILFTSKIELMDMDDALKNVD